MRKSVNLLDVPKQRGAFSPLLKVGDFVFISGIIGYKENTNELADSVEQQAQEIFKDLEKMLVSLKMHINQVVELTIYLTDSQDLDVVDAVFAEYFKHPYPARSIIYVEGLPDNASLQVSGRAIDLSAYEAMAGCSDEGCNSCDTDDCEMEQEIN